MHRNGTGYELLRHQDVSEFLKKAEEDAATAILKTPVEGLPGVTGITVLKPFPGNTALVVWVNKTNNACDVLVFPSFPKLEISVISYNNPYWETQVAHTRKNVQMGTELSDLLQGCSDKTVTVMIQQHCCSLVLTTLTIRLQQICVRVVTTTL